MSVSRADHVELKALEDDLGQRDLTLSEREKKLEENKGDFSGATGITRRELEADAGFSRRNHEALIHLEAEGEALREQFSRHRKQIDGRRAVFECELHNKRDQLAAEVRASVSPRTQKSPRSVKS